MIKALAFDVDGTLCENGNRMSPALRALLSTLQEQGMHLVLATGRPLSDLRTFQKENDFEVPAIVLNGAAVAEGEDLRDCVFMEEKTVQSICALLRSLDLPFVCYQAHENIVVSSSRFTYAQLMRRYLPNSDLDALFDSFSEDQSRFRADRVLKIETCLDDPKRREALAERMRQIAGIHAVSSMHFNLEMSDQAADKGTSLLRYLNAKGIHAQETLVFGDSENDQTMLSLFPHSVWVNNGVGKTIYACYEAKPCAQDGVYHFLKSYLQV